jgi:hypothetical protein
MTTRLLDWQLEFAKCVDKNRAKAFVWGEHDCVLWAANALIAITGHDPAEEFRGQYSTALGAARILEQAGGMEALVSKQLEREPVPAAFANVGDILLVMQEDRPMLAVCNGETMFAPGLEGLVSLPTLSAVKAWKV